jgi:hypothetical protein
VLLFAIVAHRFPFDSVEAIRSVRYSMSRRFSPPLAAFVRRLLQVFSRVNFTMLSSFTLFVFLKKNKTKQSLIFQSESMNMNA